ncbi:hypothetical protein [Ancrocorticia sp.]|uniref:hypothetical protein n=1 Tax=Ancrocorticia sp. TaxID=2593684 RepID=UPI003F8E6FC2
MGTEMGVAVGLGSSERSGSDTGPDSSVVPDSIGKGQLELFEFDDDGELGSPALPSGELGESLGELGEVPGELGVSLGELGDSLGEVGVSLGVSLGESVGSLGSLGEGVGDVPRSTVRATVADADVSFPSLTV